MFYLHKNLYQHFNSTTPLFDQLMSLQAVVYREQEGRKTQRVQLGKKTYFIKQHKGIGWKEVLKNLFQGRLPVTSAQNEWQALQQLQKLKIPVPRVFGYGKRGLNIAAMQSFVLLEALTQTKNLEEITQSWKDQPPSFQFKKNLLSQVASIARTLHQNGINHRDFYLCHFLIKTKELIRNNFKIYLIDLHRAQIRSHTPKRWRTKDLAGLYFSSKESQLTERDYYRFIKLYSGGKKLKEIFYADINFWKKAALSGEKLYRDHSIKR